MSDKERKEFEAILKSYKKKLSGNRKASRALLVKTGIVTKKGNLTKNYKHLCIPQEQA
jgi:hypothetical protein